MTKSHQEVTKAKDSNIIVSVRVRPLNSKELDVTNIEIDERADLSLAVLPEGGSRRKRLT